MRSGDGRFPWFRCMSTHLEKKKYKNNTCVVFRRGRFIPIFWPRECDTTSETDQRNDCNETAGTPAPRRLAKPYQGAC